MRYFYAAIVLTWFAVTWSSIASYAVIDYAEDEKTVSAIAACTILIAIAVVLSCKLLKKRALAAYQAGRDPLDLGNSRRWDRLMIRGLPVITSSVIWAINSCPMGIPLIAVVAAAHIIGSIYYSSHLVDVTSEVMLSYETRPNANVADQGTEIQLLNQAALRVEQNPGLRVQPMAAPQNPVFRFKLGAARQIHVQPMNGEQPPEFEDSD